LLQVIVSSNNPIIIERFSESIAKGADCVKHRSIRIAINSKETTLTQLDTIFNPEITNLKIMDGTDIQTEYTFIKGNIREVGIHNIVNSEGARFEVCIDLA
jgi:hypothetical protein